jgi:tetratricopeptide (TPR) repeat protein
MGVALLALATLNPWISTSGLTEVAGIAGWDFGLPFGQPLRTLLGLVLSRLTDAGIPAWSNAVTAVLAGLVAFILARCVALLPHDRRTEQRTRESSDIALLTIPLAWVPPVFAVLLLALQLTFWEHATAFTGEMIDLLLFAYAIKCLLEYRLSQAEPQLWRFALTVGLGLAENYAMIGFVPLFLVAVGWIRGLSFFNLGFLVRMLGFTVLGFSLLLITPWIAKASGRFDDSYWDLVLTTFILKKNALLSLPRGRFLLFAIIMVLPLAAIGIRWGGTTGATGLDKLAANVAWQVLQFAWFVACIAMAFDLKFGPRELGYGIPLLTFHFCAALSAGYFAGYYLLLFSRAPVSKHFQPGALTRTSIQISGALVLAAAVAVPAVLVWRNLPKLRAQNGSALRDYALAMLGSLPEQPCLVISDDATLATVLIAAQHTGGFGDRHVVINNRLAPTQDYRHFMAARYGGRWPRLTEIARVKENVAGQWLSLAVEAALTNRAYFTTTPVSFFAEPLDFQTVGALQRAVPSTGLLAAAASPAELDGIERFWTGLKPALDRLIADQATGARDPAFVAGLWSRTANSAGVVLQRAGRLPAAAQLFETAQKVVEGNNVAAEINLAVNQALTKGQPAPAEASKIWLTRFPAVDKTGPVDEPAYLHFLGQSVLGQKDDLTRRAAVFFHRAGQLLPGSRTNALGLAAAALAATDFATATNTLRGLRTGFSAGTWPPIEEAWLLRLEAQTAIQLGNMAAAEAPLIRARELAPQVNDTHDYLTYFYLVQARLPEALAAVDAWLKSQPQNKNALSRRTIVLMQQQDYPKAVEDLSRLLDADPGNATARINRAISNLMLNQLADSRRDYEQLIEDKLDGFQVRFGLAEIARREAKPADELLHLQRYAALASPQSPEYTNVLARIAELKH